MPKLLRKNIDDFEKVIDVGQLPLMFRDAIEMCRRIGLSYLWIDSLCLVQDNDLERDLEMR